MPEPLRATVANFVPVEMPGFLPITDHVGTPSPANEPNEPLLLIRRNGLIFKRCQHCGKLTRLRHPED